MATLEFSPIVDQAAFAHDLSEVDVSVYATEQGSTAPTETDILVSGPARGVPRPQVDRSATAAVMDTDKI